jgi:membrane-associated phospholipid phosphatase
MGQSVTESLGHLVFLDQLVLELSAGLRWAPLTVLFVVASSWWIKGPLFVAIGAVGDVHSRRRFPFAAALASVTATAGAVMAALLKEAFDRERPALADPGFEPLVGTPGSPSFPSGHATTAFAAAALVGAFHPRLRIPVYAMATLVALSRVYLGVHFWLDVTVGAVLGTALGLGIAAAAQRLRA